MEDIRDCLQVLKKHSKTPSGAKACYVKAQHVRKEEGAPCGQVVVTRPAKVVAIAVDEERMKRLMMTRKKIKAIDECLGDDNVV